MAICPKCKGEMEQTEAVCPQCGYDFPLEKDRKARAGLAYSVLADAALVLGQYMAGLACILAIVACIRSLASKEWIDAFIRGPILVVLLLAMFVVFRRTQDVT